MVLRRRPAQAVERAEENRPGAGLVGRKLEVLLPGVVPEPGPGAARLQQVEAGPAEEGADSASRATRSERRAEDSFRLTGTLRCDGATVTLPRLGVITTHETTVKLARPAGGRRRADLVGDGDPRRAALARVSRRRRRPGRPVRHIRPGTAIGIDIGVKTLITGADHQGTVIVIRGPRPLRAGLRRLRRASRAHARKPLGSARRRRAAARLAACTPGSRTSALTRCTRPPAMLAARYETIVAEDLNVAGDDPQPPPRPRHR